MIDAPNVELLRKELEFVTNNPDVWDQAHWIIRQPCGTVACLAGWTVIHAGLKPSAFNEYLTPKLAAHMLGLTRDSANRLFYHGNTLHDLWRIAGELTNGEIKMPLHLSETP